MTDLRVRHFVNVASPVLILQRWYWPDHCKKICCFKCGCLLRDRALYFGNCDTLHRNITHDQNANLDFPIKYYFGKEMAYQTVVHVLDACHDIQINTELWSANWKRAFCRTWVSLHGVPCWCPASVYSFIKNSTSQ